MDDPFAIPLEFGAKVVGVFLVLSPQTFPAFGGVGRKQGSLLFFKVFPGTDRHKIVMDGRLGESRDGKFSKEQGVKKRRTGGNKSARDWKFEKRIAEKNKGIRRFVFSYEGRLWATDYRLLGELEARTGRRG